ncbi:hypothetical protein BDY19DRAFT_904028 [Irpex rosettiformis]|uniref:Uncharacterized protein n=1 Tax=Irpex rosettiformis TaxID=378272 RepID=A0ACB8UDL8_9APHY|nr:hypothetical protein BDY19DRAFT_904028 [Irpex rosettiformis]
MSLDAYGCPELCRLDLGGVQKTLLHTVQTRLAQTRWQLNEEREERMRLERQLLQPAPGPPPSEYMTSIKMSISSSSESTLMDFDEDIWGSDESKGEDFLPAVPELCERQAQGTLVHENETLATEIQQLRQLLSAERASREALEQGLSSMRQSLEKERQLRIQAERSLRSIAPMHVPSMMEALTRLAQLTDKVMLVDGL